MGGRIFLVILLVLAALWVLSPSHAHARVTHLKPERQEFVRLVYFVPQYPICRAPRPAVFA